MNSVDFAYLVMLDIVNSDQILKNATDIIIAYNKKVANVYGRDALYLYEVNKTHEFLGIGGKYVLETFITTANYLTMDMRRLAIFEKRLVEQYTARHYSFWDDGSSPSIALEEGIDFTKIVRVSSNIDKVELIDPDQYSFERGEKIQVTSSGFDYGFVWGVYGNDLYVFYGEGEYMLTRIERALNISDRYKGFYEVSYDLTGKILRKTDKL